MPYLAQRYIAGGTLADGSSATGGSTLDTLVEICAQVAGGLDALHADGLFHRDVKPANILLDEEGTAYITDFGLAKDSQGSLLTRPGQALGSLDYMAPEQIRSEESRRHRRLRARVRLLRVPVRGAAVRRPPGHARPVGPPPGSPANPSDRRPDLPDGVSTAILKALEKEPTQRQGSASELADQLRSAAG